jgi:hypothetical protein
MVGGKKKYVDMTKHPSFKGGLNSGNNGNPRKHGLNSGHQQGPPKQTKKEPETCMADLPAEVIDLIKQLAFNTKLELKSFKTLNVPTTQASKAKMDKLLEMYKTIIGVGMSSRNAATKGLSGVRMESPQQVKQEFTAWGQDWRIKDFGYEMQKLLEGDDTPISLLWKKADGLDDDLFITYSVKQTNGSYTDTIVRIFLDKPIYANHSIEYPIKMSIILNLSEFNKLFLNSDNTKDTFLESLEKIPLNLNEFMTKNRTEYGNYTLMKKMYDILFVKVPEKLGLNGGGDWYIKKAQYIQSNSMEKQNGYSAQHTEEDMVYIHTYYEYTPPSRGGRRNFRKTTPPSRNPKTSPVVRKATTSKTTNASRRSTTSSSGVSNATSTSARRSKKN